MTADYVHKACAFSITVICKLPLNGWNLLLEYESENQKHVEMYLFYFTSSLPVNNRIGYRTSPNSNLRSWKVDKATYAMFSYLTYFVSWQDMQASAKWIYSYLIKWGQKVKHKAVKMFLLNYTILTVTLLVAAHSHKAKSNPGNWLQ
jgi:hypothetical protein